MLVSHLLFGLGGLVAQWKEEEEEEEEGLYLRIETRKRVQKRREEEEEEEEERLYLHLETRERVQTNEAKSKRCRASPT